MASSSRPYFEQGQRIAIARRTRSIRDGQTFTQKDLANELARNGYGRIVTQPVISEIECGRADVPRHMRAPLLRALPDLELDPLSEDQDVAVQLARIAS